MPKINIIQKAIAELDGAAFQKLVDSYLTKKGFTNINCIGSVFGKNKVRPGTPDTLITLPNGKYIFTECATNDEKRLYQKFNDDLSKCLDESKTGIKTSQIDQILLCHNGRLNIDEINSLRQTCLEHQIIPNIWGLSELSFEILEKYPGIAKDHLNIEVDTRQIVDLKTFIALHDKNKLTTSIQTQFNFRTEELAQLQSKAKCSEVTLISGATGVGKTRLAIELINKLIKESPTLKTFCIFNRGLDIFDDCQSYFSDDGEYLIFIDDCNRLSGFRFILDLLRTKRNTQTFQIVATARDYALSDIRKRVSEYTEVAELYIEPFSDDEIEKLIAQEFKIHNFRYQERITEISRGNPRIALMAANIANKSGLLKSIWDVTNIYEIYFSSIKQDIESLKNHNVLKTAGIVSFFRHVDREDAETITLISRHFDLPREQFWECCLQLNAMEIIEIHEGELVKISDQVMATYLFYLCFFKERLLNFEPLISDLFPSHKKRLVDALNPVLNTFDYERIRDFIRPFVDSVWAKCIQLNRTEILDLIDVFWFLKPVDTLLVIQSMINNLTPEVDLKQTFHINVDKIPLPDFLSILPHYKYQRDDNFAISLDILFTYIDKAPKDAGKLLHLFTDRLGFEPESCEIGYVHQRTIIDKLIERSVNENNDLYSRLFFALAPEYLKTHIFTIKAGGKNTFRRCDFELVNTPELLELRKNILTHAIKLSDSAKFKNDFYSLFQDIIKGPPTENVRSILQNDAHILTPCVAEHFKPENLYHCILACQYINQLRRFKIPQPNRAPSIYKTKMFRLYDAMFISNYKLEERIGYKKYPEYKSKKIRKQCTGFNVHDYQTFFTQLEQVFNHTNDNQKYDQLSSSLKPVFQYLAEKKPQFIVDVFSALVEKQDTLYIDPIYIMGSLYDALGKHQTFALIANTGIQKVYSWLFAFYIYLEPKDIELSDVDNVKELYINITLCHYKDLRFLLKFERHEPGLIHFVISTLVQKAETTPELALHLESLFYDYLTEKKELFNLIAADHALLQKSYILADSYQRPFDFNGSFMSKMLDINPHFLLLHLKETKFNASADCDKRDYSFIWLRGDCETIMDDVALHYQTGDNLYLASRSYKSFYMKNVRPQSDLNIIEKQDEYLADRIARHNQNKRYIDMLFDLISEFEHERKLKLTLVYLRSNTNINDFKEIRFWPSTRTWSGSKVPILTLEIQFLEALSAHCNSLQLLPHKGYLENEIKERRLEIMETRKREFTDDF